MSAIFYQIYIFSPANSPSKTIKNVFITTARQLYLYGIPLGKFFRAVAPSWVLKARFCDKDIKIGNEHQHLALPISVS